MRIDGAAKEYETCRTCRSSGRLLTYRRGCVRKVDSARGSRGESSVEEDEAAAEVEEDAAATGAAAVECAS